MDFRIEHDTMGAVNVPANRYWGAQTQRSKENFTIGGHLMPLEVIRAVAEELGMNMEAGIRQSYADLYRQHRRTRADLPENMVFAPEQLPSST